MECPFREVGCTLTKLSTNSAYQRHLSQNTEQHLQMVMSFHKTKLGNNASNSMTEESIVSPLQKLDAVAKEVEFLDSVLDSLDMGQFPSLECIKTHLKMPDLTINNLGNTLTFRLSNFSQLLQAKAIWQSPAFFIKGEHKMCVCVHLGGLGSGHHTHLSVSLLHLTDDPVEWSTVLPSIAGIRVELLSEVEDEEDEDADVEDSEEEGKLRSECHDIELTWKPAAEDSFKFRSNTSHLKREKKATIVQSWHKSTDDLASKQDRYRKIDSSADKKQEGKMDGASILKLSEKFVSLSLAHQYARQYDSLVFQVALCLV